MAYEREGQRRSSAGEDIRLKSEENRFSQVGESFYKHRN